MVIKNNILNYLKLKFSIVNKIIRRLRRDQIGYWMKEVQKRRKLSIFEFETIASEIPIPCNSLSLFIENCFYGNDIALKSKLSNLKKNSFSIEHGFIFGSLVQNSQIQCWGKTIVTCSDYRKDMISLKTSKNVICVGPYIHYADALLSEFEFSKVKEQMNRCLLVFPCHSTSDEEVAFEIEAFCDYIDTHRNNFDTVLVCLYWKDIQLGQASFYLNRGYKVTCAGHIYDGYFLSRLKTIIQLSDFVIANDIGTHLSYCWHLEKTLVLYNQQISYELKTSNEAEVSQFGIDDKESYKQVSDRLFNIFNDKSVKNGITNEDQLYLDYLFGFKHATDVS